MKRVLSQLPPPSLLDFAGRLLQHEIKKEGGALDPAGGFQCVCRGLHRRLAPLISSTGFHTLLTRARQLAARDFGMLTAVLVSTDECCVVSGLPEPSNARNPEEIEDAFAAIVSQFIALLIAFIGENLALGAVREIWPEVPFDKRDLDSEVYR
jgi:hypothetical protein